MAKRKESGADLVASLPWPAGIGLGLFAFIGIQYGIGWVWGSSDNPYLSGFAKVAATGIYTPFAWLTLIACCFAAFISFLNRRHRRRLLEKQTGMDSLRGMDWQAFELLVGEAFRRQGYAVEETGQGGADGGIDLVLRKDGLRTLVQCKQWRSKNVDVKVVREMLGILVSTNAHAVKIVALGGYTPDAAAFARGQPIELVDGNTLLSSIMDIQARKEPERASENPIFFAVGLVSCLLFAFALPSPSSQRQAIAAGPMVTPTPEVRPPASYPPATPTAQQTVMQANTQPTHKVYKADAPMTNEELREWEKKNREAMKILEKTTPELETPPPH